MPATANIIAKYANGFADDLASTSLIASNKQIIFIQEPVDVWNTMTDENNITILEKFYSDQTRWSFSFQMMAYISRISQLKKLQRENPNAILITERCVHTDYNIFAKMLADNNKISSIELKIYQKWFYEFSKDVTIDGYIYIKSIPENCLERIKQRNRKGENIEINYVKNCHEYHERWLKQINKKIILEHKTFDTWLIKTTDYINKYLKTEQFEKNNSIFEKYHNSTNSIDAPLY